jgi:hypothetical protein
MSECNTGCLQGEGSEIGCIQLDSNHLYVLDNAWFCTEDTQ